MEAIGLTRIAHTPVRCTQFAEFLGSQLVICHAGQFNRLYRGLQSGCKPNFQIGWVYIPLEQDPAAIERYLNEQFSKIQRVASKVGADIGFEDEAAVDLRERSGKTWSERGIRPDVYVTGKRGRLNILVVPSSIGFKKSLTLNLDQYLASHYSDG